MLRFRTTSSTFMPNPRPFAIVLDDHPLVGRGLAQYLQSVRPELIARAVTSWKELMALVQVQGCPRLLVADLWLAEGNSLPLLAQWHAEYPDAAWLAISADDDPAMPTDERVPCKANPSQHTHATCRRVTSRRFPRASGPVPR